MSDARSIIDVRSTGLASAIGVAIFVAVCTAAQFFRSDLDWTRAPLSFYLIGPGGWVVKVAYLVLSASLVGIGTGFYRSLDLRSRSGIPLFLFVISGAALAVTAISDTGTKRGDVSLHARIHVLAAGTTFVCVTTALLWQSLRLRADATWRPLSGFAFGLAAVAFAALWIYALYHSHAKGLMQKIVIGLILTWLAWAALALWRTAARKAQAEVMNSEAGVGPD